MNEQKDQSRKANINDFKLVPLVHVQHLCDKCIEMLNKEWPRSITQRERSIKACLNVIPPMSLVLLDSTMENLIGHARVCPMPSEADACWVESVIVGREFRGLGIGRIFMQLLEENARSLNYKKMHLSTEDKELFYEKCGYKIGPPVVNVGAHSKLFEKCSNLFQNIQTNLSKTFLSNKIEEKPPSVVEETARSNTTVPSPPSHPPPPPLPPPRLFPATKFEENSSLTLHSRQRILPERIVYMCKTIV